MGQNIFFKTQNDESSLESHYFKKSITAACVRFEDWMSLKIEGRVGFVRIVISFGRLFNSAASFCKMA